MKTTEAPELRTYATVLELRDAEGAGAGRVYRHLEGRAVPYNTWTDMGLFMERHAARSFEASTKGGTGRGLPLLMFHERAAFPVGVAEKWQHDDDAMYGRWRLADTDEAQRAARAAADGQFGLSVGYQPIHSDVTKRAKDWAPELGPEHKDWITRNESRLIEVSLTPIPAFDAAEVLMVRSAYQHEHDGAGEASPGADAWRAVVDGLRSGSH
jgi:HK97 family phage prohead protease